MQLNLPLVSHNKQLPTRTKLINLLSFSTGTAIAFHTFNGVRHLAWDAGYGFAIKDLYKSGYAVLGKGVANVQLCSLSG